MKLWLTPYFADRLKDHAINNLGWPAEKYHAWEEENIEFYDEYVKVDELDNIFEEE